MEEQETMRCACGSMQSSGHYTCCNCGNKLYLSDNQSLPKCPRCDHEMYTKDHE